MAFRRLLTLFLALCIAVACLGPAFCAPAKKKAKKKAYDYENSKYKAYRELADEPRTYRFDERGNPILPKDKKKAAAKKKKNSEEKEPAEDRACGAGEPCQDEEAQSGD